MSDSIATAANPDDTSGLAFNNNKCSYSSYLGSKLLQYVAVIEVIKELATNEQARRSLFESFMDSAAGHLIQGDFAGGQAKTALGSAEDHREAASNGSWEDRINQFGHDYFGGAVPWAKDGSPAAYHRRMADEETRRSEAFQARSDYHYDMAKAKIKDFFVSIWKEIQRRWRECGLLYAFATTATDAVFFVGELALGAGLTASALKLLKSVKFSTHVILPKGAVTAAVKEGMKVTKDTSIAVTVTVGLAGSPIRKMYRKYEAGTLAQNYHIEGRTIHSGVERKDPEPPIAVAKPETSGRKLTPEEYKALRKETPTDELRRAVNDGQPIPTKESPVPDEWLPGQVRTKLYEADHIVPMKTITEMDGFADLPYAQQVEILNMPENFAPMSRSANASKSDLSFEEWTTFKKTGVPVNPELRAKYMEIERKKREVIQNKIYELLRQSKQPYRDD